MKRKLQRKRAPRRALLKNLAVSLILYEKIKTTLEKAKEVRSFVEHLISKGKDRDLSSRRYLLRFLPKHVVAKVLEDLVPSYADKKSGYLKISKLSERKGDGALMAILEFTDKKPPVQINKEDSQKRDTLKKAEKK